MMPGKTRIVLIGGCVALSIVLAATYIPAQLDRVARRDVLRRVERLAEPGKAPIVTSSEMRWSLHHGALVICRLENVCQLSKAVWYLWPWRKIELEK